MKLLVIFLAFVALSCAGEVLEGGGKKTTKRGISGYGHYGYASDFGYGHYGYYSPVISTPVVTKVSYGHRPYYGGYYGGYYGHGFGHGLYGYGHGDGLGYGHYGHGYGLGYGYGHHYPWNGYYGLGHGFHGLGHGYHGLGHGYYGLGHYGYNDWW